MKLSRSTLGLTLLVGLGASFPSHAQQIIHFTTNEPVTRVSVPGNLTQFALSPTWGPNFVLCESLANSPEWLKVQLAGALMTKSTPRRVLNLTEIQALINQVESEPDWRKKLEFMFVGVDAEMTRNLGNSPWAVQGNDFMAQLALGQEVTMPKTAICYTMTQINQIIAEGLRVMRAVAQALAPAGQAMQKPAIPGMGIGIQKP